MKGPPLVALSWDERSGFWRADKTGDIYRLQPDGGRWVQAGSMPGEAQAILARDRGVVVAATGPGGVIGIHESPNGSDWKLLYRDRNG